MKVSQNFLSQLQSYVDGKLDLKSFRDWQLSLLLDREKFSPEDQEFLVAIEGEYAGLLAGVSEDAFKDSLKSLLPDCEIAAQRPPYIFVLVKDAIVPQPVPVFEEYEVSTSWSGTSSTRQTYRRRPVHA
jgi:hypothetical protein